MTKILIDKATVVQVLEALESCSGAPHWSALQPALTSLREALAEQPAQYSDIVSDGGLDPRNKFVSPGGGYVPAIPVMNKPRLDQGPDYERGFVDGMQRKPLTDEQIDAEFDAFASKFDHESNEWLDMGVDAYFRAGFKAAHGIKEKNT